MHLKSDFGLALYRKHMQLRSAQPNISGVDIEKCRFPRFTKQQLIDFMSEQLQPLLLSKIIL
jgi:hypothetical protein